MYSKYKIGALLSVGLILGLASCKKDFLERNPLNSVSSQVFWASEADVKTGVAGVYFRLKQNFLGYERVYLDGLSDNAYFFGVNTNQGNLAPLTTGGISAGLTGALVNMYSTPYRVISSANYFLDNVDKAPISEAAKNAYKAEVRFLRAFAYFELVQTFGGVPVYRNYLTLLGDYKIAKSSKDEVYAFIHEDLDFAIANLPDTKYVGNTGGVANGHAVKGSALGIKARVLLTQQRWAEAVPVLEQIINNASGKFKLSNDFAALFKTSGQANADVNAEIMFATQYLAPSDPQRISPGAAGIIIELGRDGLLQPYQDLVNDYEMTNGGPANSTNPLYNPANPYANRDPRLDLTVKLPGEVWMNGSTVVNPGVTSATGFFVEKYVDFTRGPFSNSTALAAATDQDFIHLRYADVLLMYAEAKNEVSGPDASVYDAINQVRARPGINMPPVDQTIYDTKEELRDYIRHERRVEFAFEGLRYNELKRWNIAHVKLPTLKDAANIPLVFSTTNYLLPFPSSELLNNPQLVQNPGYN